MRKQDFAKALKSKFNSEASALPAGIHTPTVAVILASLCDSASKKLGIDFRDAAEALLTWSVPDLLEWANAALSDPEKLGIDLENPAEDADLIIEILGG